MNTEMDREVLHAAVVRERDLNGRQREVLAMMASGLTNPQIAEKLGLSLDGAKWNVSEVLTKLGFASREEATAFYRWHQRPSARLERWVRALVALPAAKWVAAGTATAAVAGGGIVYALLQSGSPAQVASPSTPFALEATVRVEDRGRTAGTALQPDAFTTNSTITWLYESNELYRYRVASTSEAEGDRVSEVVSDGSELWTFGDRLNSYQRGPLPTNWPKELLPNPGFSSLVGPAPAKTAAEFIATLNQNNSASNAFVSITGREVLLGRPVTVIEVGPTSTGTSSDGVETSSGTARIWLDEAEMVILRYDIIESDAASLSMVVTRFDRPVQHGRDAFRFVPPAGAVERPATTSTSGERFVSSSGSYSSTGGGVPGGTMAIQDVPGFLRPSYLPPGFRAVGEETGEEDGQTTSRTITFASGAADDATGPRITLIERVRSGGVEDSAKKGDVTTVRGVQAFVKRTGDIVSITWAEGGHVFSVAGIGVSEDELRAVAEGLTR